MLARALLALSLLSATGALAAPLASAFGPQAPWAEPSGGYVGRLKVTPEHAPSGTLLTVTAEGLPAEQEFDLVWRTVTGTWRVANAEYHGREYTPVAYHIAKVKADIAGRATTTFTAPEDYGFNHDVVLQQGVRLFTQAGFNLDMTVKLSPESGPPGTPITVEVKGIGWRHLQNSYVLLYDNNFTGWMSTVTTGGSATFTIPATGKPGVHVLELLHADLPLPTATCSSRRNRIVRVLRCSSASRRIRRCCRRHRNNRRRRTSAGSPNRANSSSHRGFQPSISRSW